ncbi:MAG TPA: DUF485 domain-containing protein [Actinopolymorphaceae bacterium]|jgi:uncharacterized membrane protein (DUF485 family)|uniref:Uncharacterized membrane protein (DUF485 family) n=1 Tax=Thermasporomyces composti TaxID=696763 RepID=A0A3D9VHS3_THECX|nr:DUF485 domain-containing protein [Thermasporomyces composti]REF36851.1 uncharacterized membrane protein (DUF485 family) [Thermasporomyces composti]
MTEPPAGPAANESAANDPIDQSATTDASVTDETHATTAAAQRRAYAELARSDDFRELRRRYRGFVFPWTIAFLAWYVLYVFCAMWAPGLMRTSVIGNVNVALVFGLLQFVSTFLIAYLYSRHARRRLDPKADQILTRYAKAVER